MAFIPEQPWSELPEDRRSTFFEVPGVDFFETASEEQEAQELFAVGFGYTAEEYDAMGIDPDAVHDAREQFFDFMGLEWDDFPWDEWREAMGYE
jgi:hypothetical protein